MREIKFRFWSHGTMWPDYAGFDESMGINEMLAYMDDGGGSVMQYTGLKDGIGVEIYEGDYVEFAYWWFDGNAAESTLRGEVVYLTDCMSFGLRHVKNSEWCDHVGADRKVGDTDSFGQWLFDEADFIVIGNVHENPELAEVVE